MTSLNLDEFRLLVRRAGLDLPEDELERLKGFYDAFEARMGPLRDADLSEEEVAGRFLPGWNSEVAL